MTSVKTRLFVSHIVVQICIGTLLPIVLLGATQVMRFSEITRRRVYGAAGMKSNAPNDSPAS